VIGACIGEVSDHRSSNWEVLVTMGTAL